MEADQPGLGFICFNVTHGAVELTSLTAKPAVPLCLCRGLCSSCLPALTVVWTCYDKKKRSHFLLFTLSISTFVWIWHSLCTAVSLSLSHVCILSRSLEIKLTFFSAPLPSPACCSFHLSLTSFHWLLTKEIISYPYCTPLYYPLPLTSTSCTHTV